MADITVRLIEGGSVTTQRFDENVPFFVGDNRTIVVRWPCCGAKEVITGQKTVTFGAHACAASEG